MKRILALMAIFTLLITTAVACSKDKTKTDSNTTPTVGANDNTLTLEDLNSFKDDPGYIALGGSFSGKNTNLSIFISGSSLYVNGIVFSNKDASPLILSGPLTYSKDTSFIYEDNDNKLTFTFAATSLTIDVNKGTAYAAFDGTFDRLSKEVAETGSVVPKSGSPLEFIGRIALTHYMVNAEGSSSYTFNTSAVSFDNATMLKFISLYADLFLTNNAEPMPEISEKYLCYAFTEDDLNNLLLAATAGTFSVNDLSVADSDIVLKDDVYYVPCTGTYAGGIASNYTDENPEVIATNLALEAGVVKMDGTRYDLEMVLSTSANDVFEITGVQIDTITYKTIK